MRAVARRRPRSSPRRASTARGRARARRAALARSASCAAQRSPLGGQPGALGLERRRSLAERRTREDGDRHRPRPAPPPVTSADDHSRTVRMVSAPLHPWWGRRVPRRAARRSVPCSSLYSDPDGRRQPLELTADAPRVTIGRRPTLRHRAAVGRRGLAPARRARAHGRGLGRLRRRPLAQRHVRQRRAGARAAAAAPRATSITVGAHADLGVRAPSDRDAPRRPAPRGPATTPVAVTPAQRRLLEALCRPLLDDRLRRARLQPRDRGRADDLASTPSRARCRRCTSCFGLTALPQNEKRAALAARALELLQR